MILMEIICIFLIFFVALGFLYYVISTIVNVIKQDEPEHVKFLKLQLKQLLRNPEKWSYCSYSYVATHNNIRFRISRGWDIGGGDNAYYVDAHTQDGKFRVGIEIFMFLVYRMMKEVDKKEDHKKLEKIKKVIQC